MAVTNPIVPVPIDAINNRPAASIGSPNVPAGPGLNHAVLGITLAITIALAACAGPSVPTGQMAVSTAALAAAVSAEGGELAPGEMGSARDKLERANNAMAAKDYPLARALAEQSEVDAQLAVAKARSAKAQTAAQALQDDNRVLREEIDRNTR